LPSATKAAATERAARWIIDGLFSEWLDEQVAIEAHPPNRRDVDLRVP
jgi:hypothetical protein